MEGARALGDRQHTRALPHGDGQRHDEQGDSLPAASESAGSVTAMRLTPIIRAVPPPCSGRFRPRDTSGDSSLWCCLTHRSVEVARDAAQARAGLRSPRNIIIMRDAPPRWVVYR